MGMRSKLVKCICAVQVVLPLGFCGCIGVLPIPEFSNQPIHGTKLRAQDTAFIQPGNTTAAQVFARLGTNCLCDPRQRAVAFSWELPGGRGLWWMYGPYGGGGNEFEWSRWRAFFVAFDTNNVVVAASAKHLSSSRSLHEHLEVWARKHDAAPDHIHPELFFAKDLDLRRTIFTLTPK